MTIRAAYRAIHTERYSNNMTDAYHIAQRALADLKAAVRLTLETNGSNGMSNAEIGRTLGIYAGHVGHEGHISRTVLALMESEGVVAQDAESKRWTLRVHSQTAESAGSIAAS